MKTRYLSVSYRLLIQAKAMGVFRLVSFPLVHFGGVSRQRKKRGHLGLTLEFSIGNHNHETRIEMDGIDLVGTNNCINSDEPIENANSAFQLFDVSKHEHEKEPEYEHEPENESEPGPVTTMLAPESDLKPESSSFLKEEEDDDDVTLDVLSDDDDVILDV